MKVYNQAVSAAEAKYLYDNAASIAISGDVSSAFVGDTAELNADFISTNEVAVKWSSSNEEVATVAVMERLHMLEKVRQVLKLHLWMVRRKLPVIL